MKKSRIAKFALLGASTAALAATLTTSTYAWYVSNKTATVEKMDGQTAAGAADGSILLSWDNKSDGTTYYKELKWTDGNIPQNVVTTKDNVTTFAQQLSPLYYVSSNGSFTSMASYAKTEDTALANGKTYFTESNGVFTQVASPDVEDIATYYEEKNQAQQSNTGFVRFSMYIKSTKEDTVVTLLPTLKSKLTANIANGIKQIAYVNTGSITQGQSFLVDAFDAMYYSLHVNDGSTDYTGLGTQFAVCEAPTTGKAASSIGASKPAAAHTYYEAVTGETIDKTYKTETTTSSLTTLTVGTTPIKLTWTVWLSGNDVDCYNSCAGQPFEFDVKYNAA